MGRIRSKGQGIFREEQRHTSESGQQSIAEHDGEASHTSRRLMEPPTSRSRVLSFPSCSSHGRGHGRDNNEAAVPDIPDMEGTQSPESAGKKISAQSGSVHNDLAGFDGSNQGDLGRRGLRKEGNRSANDSNEGRRQRQRDAFLGLFGLQSFGEKKSWTSTFPQSIKIG